MSLRPWMVFDWGNSPKCALPIAAWSSQLRFIELQRCACGGAFAERPAREARRSREALEHYPCRCVGCGRPRDFWFRAPTLTRRMQCRLSAQDAQLRAQTERALEERAWSDAAELLDELCARDPWLGEHWLNRSLLWMKGDARAETLDCLERAGALLPLSPVVRGVMTQYWHLQGDQARAREAWQHTLTLQGLFDEEERSPDSLLLTALSPSEQGTYD